MPQALQSEVSDYETEDLNVNKIFNSVYNFIDEVYEIDLTKPSIDSKIKKNKELKNAYKTIKDITLKKRMFLSDEFFKYIYPIFEVSEQWYRLKSTQGITEDFFEKCKQRVKTQSNFYGTIFEIDMTSRIMLSNWDIEFVEDYTSENKQIDFLILNEKYEYIGIECLSKRYTNNLTIKKLNNDIHEKSKKFNKKYLNEMNVTLDKKVLIIDITRDDYSKPNILLELDDIKISSKIDAVIFTWKEDHIHNKGHKLLPKYEIKGDMDDKYFSVTLAAEFVISDNGPVFFMRKYVEPEPTCTIGPTETRNE